MSAARHQGELAPHGTPRRSPRCGQPMQTWNDRIAGGSRVCVRALGHHGEHWSLERYQAHLAANRRYSKKQVADQGKETA